MNPQEDIPTRLFVQESTGESSTKQADEKFVINEALRETPETEYDQVYRSLSNADINLNLPYPVFEIAWIHIMGYRRGQLHELILLYKRLEEVIEAANPNTIICSNNLSRKYRAVIVDMGSKYDIDVTCRVRPSLLSRLQRFIVSSVLLLPFFLDQFLGLILKSFVNNTSKKPIVFVPALGRLDSMVPVFNKMNSDFEVVVASMASSWLWMFRNDELDEFEPVPVSLYTSVGCIARQILAHVRICKAVFFNNELKHELQSFLSTELDVDLDRTLVYSLQQGFRTRMFTSIFLYELFGAVYEGVQCDAVVTGSFSPAGRAIVQRAITSEIDANHIPHGIGAAANSPNAPPELTYFVSGELEKRHWTDSPQVETPWNCIVTGRPYLTELHSKYATQTADKDPAEPYKIVMATQPSDVRIEFVEKSIAAVQRAKFDAEITIKIHPSESMNTYTQYADEHESVTVADSNLHEILHSSDLLLTINSNVGVESVIVGTPCVSLSWWSPIIPVPMYALYDGVPVFYNPDELDAFFDDLTDSKLVELLENETDIINESYELTDDAGSNIATELEQSLS